MKSWPKGFSQPFVQGESKADRTFERAGTGFAGVRALPQLMGGDLSF